MGNTNTKCTCKNWGGLANPPDPGGVPVKIISPGSSVQNLVVIVNVLTWDWWHQVNNVTYFDKKEMQSKTPWMSWLVLLVCLIWPLTLHEIFKLCGSGILSAVRMFGPMGQKPSIVFPSSHRPPFFFPCASRVQSSRSQLCSRKRNLLLN
jgi:hypothetical protein